MAARYISTAGGPPAWAVESCCLDGRVWLAKQQGKWVAHRLSRWPTDVETDGRDFFVLFLSLKICALCVHPKDFIVIVKPAHFYGQ